MANFTPNYNLEKPIENEKYYISKFNANADKVDTALKSQSDTISANKTKEEQDISELRTEVKGYTDSQISEHNLSESAHPFIQQKLTDALDEAKAYAEEYADTKATPNDVADAIAEHNMSEDAHQDIRDELANISETTQSMIDNSIALHNIDEDAHPYIVSNAEAYTNNAISTHNLDPEAHGGKQILYTILTPSNGVYSSSMSYVDIQTAFSNGKGVNALIQNGGEFPLTNITNSVVGTRTSMEGNELVFETYMMNPNTNTFTRTVNRYALSLAPTRVDEAVTDYSIVVDPESKSNDAIIGSAVIGVSTIGNSSSSGGGDEPLYVEFTPVSSTSSDLKVTCNVSADQIVTALNNKRRVVSVMKVSDNSYVEFQLMQYGIANDKSAVVFSFIEPSDNEMTYIIITMLGDEINVQQFTIRGASSDTSG